MLVDVCTSVGVDEALARGGRKRSRPTGVLQKPGISNNLKSVSLNHHHTLTAKEGMF